MVKVNYKLVLSPKECAEYTHIGEQKIREIAENNPTLDWVLKIGAHLKIKRPLFERWLDSVSYIEKGVKTMKYKELPERDKARFRELINKHGFDSIAENNKYFDSVVHDRFGYVIRFIDGEFLFDETEKNESGGFRTTVRIAK